MDASSISKDDDLSDYDIISNCDSSIVDSDGHLSSSRIQEPPISQQARETFETLNFSAEDIQEFTKQFLSNNAPFSELNAPTDAVAKPVRIYVDGIYDPFSVADALQLRQAKLSFYRVYLIVGVFSDEQCTSHGFVTSIPHLERCEVVRNCRWVDEIISEAPWSISEDFLQQYNIQYLAIEEGSTVDPKMDNVRLRGYDIAKKLGRVIPTRKTPGQVSTRFPAVVSESNFMPESTPEPLLDFES